MVTEAGEVSCKNDRCDATVRRSTGRGRPREYCKTQCRQRDYARKVYGRERPPRPDIEVLGPVFVQVVRDVPSSVGAAERRYKQHKESCSLYGGRCPDADNHWRDARRCIVGAVLADDWTELAYPNADPSTVRVSTSRDGRWLDDRGC
jgi:hypothetical protein